MSGNKRKNITAGIAESLINLAPLELAPIADTARSVMSQTLFPNVVGTTILPPLSANTKVVRERTTDEHNAEVATAHPNDATPGIPPLSWDWRYQQHADMALPFAILPPANQLNCGSCYAFAVSAVLRDRASIIHKRVIPVLSVTELVVIDESASDEIKANLKGCDGGTPYWAAMYASERGLGQWVEQDYKWAIDASLDASGHAVSTPVDMPESAYSLYNSGYPLASAVTAGTYGGECFRGLGHRAAGVNSNIIGFDAVWTPYSPQRYNKEFRVFVDPNSVKQLPTTSLSRHQQLHQVLLEISRHGPLVSTFLVPGDFTHAWVLGGDSVMWWPETNGVYMHCISHKFYTNSQPPRNIVGTWSESGEMQTGVTQPGKTPPNRCITGAHAVRVVGYVNVHDVPTIRESPIRCWVVTNSWGTGFFQDGYFLVAFSGYYTLKGGPSDGALISVNEHILLDRIDPVHQIGGFTTFKPEFRPDAPPVSRARRAPAGRSVDASGSAPLPSTDASGGTVCAGRHRKAAADAGITVVALGVTLAFVAVVCAVSVGALLVRRRRAGRDSWTAASNEQIEQQQKTVGYLKR